MQSEGFDLPFLYHIKDNFFTEQLTCEIAIPYEYTAVLRKFVEKKRCKSAHNAWVVFRSRFLDLRISES